MKKLRKVLLLILAGIVFIVGSVYIAFQVSPYPGAFIIGHLFGGEVTVQDQLRYDQAQPHVQVIKDETYTSKYASNTFDIYYPKDTEEKVPVVFWVHGGGYVGGDKYALFEYATYLVHEVGVAVVAINYEHAPDSIYPGQVTQLDEAYRYIYDKSEQYPMLDLNRVFFGGDSAGAQIAAQYVVIQSNPTYAQEMNITPQVTKEHLLGYLSYCGPLDLVQMKDAKSSNAFMNFFMDTVAWSLLGTKNWYNSPAIDQLSLINHITEDFPPSYITDGNAFSFQDQGIAFSQKLESYGIETKTLFFKDSTEEVTHEYQFSFGEDNAKKSLELTIDFLLSQLLVNNVRS